MKTDATLQKPEREGCLPHRESPPPHPEVNDPLKHPLSSPHRLAALFLVFLFALSIFLPTSALAAGPTLDLTHPNYPGGFQYLFSYLGGSQSNVSYQLSSGYSVQYASWSSSIPSVASVTGSAEAPVFTALSEGASIMTLTIDTTTGEHVSASFTFTVEKRESMRMDISRQVLLKCSGEQGQEHSFAQTCL